MLRCHRVDCASFAIPSQGTEKFWSRKSCYWGLETLGVTCWIHCVVPPVATAGYAWLSVCPAHPPVTFSSLAYPWLLQIAVYKTGFSGTWRFHGTPLGVPREVVEWIQNYFEIPHRIINIPRNIAVSPRKKFEKHCSRSNMNGSNLRERVIESSTDII